MATMSDGHGPDHRRPRGRFFFLQNFEALVDAVRHVATVGTAPGRDGFHPAQLGRDEKAWCQSADWIKTELEAGRLKPKRCTGPADGPVPCVSDRVLARDIVDVQLAPIEAALPPDVRGHRKGSSTWMVQHEIDHVIKGMRNPTIVIGDCVGHFEAIKSDVAIDIAADHGVADEVIDWMSFWYAVQPAKYEGLIRSIGWAPLCASAYLRPLDDLAAASATFYRRVGDDIFAAFTDDDSALEFLCRAEDTLGELGLRLHNAGEKATYIGGADGRFRYLGIEYNQRVAHPAGYALDRLLEKLLKASAKKEPLEPILKGFAGQYTVAAGSPRFEDAADLIQAEWPGLSKLDVLVEEIAEHDSRRLQRHHRLSRAGARNRGSGHQATRLPHREPGTGEDPVTGATPTATAAPVTTMPVPASLARSSARRVLEDALASAPDEMEHLRRLHPGELWRVISASGWTFATISEALGVVRRLRAYRRLNYTTWDAFCRLHLAEDSAFVDRVILVGLATLDAFASGGVDVAWSFQHRQSAEDLEDRVPRLPLGLMRALAGIQSDKFWVQKLASFVLSLVAMGLISSRSGKDCVREAVARAVREVKRGPGRRRARVRWQARMKNGMAINQDLEIIVARRWATGR